MHPIYPIAPLPYWAVVHQRSVRGPRFPLAGAPEAVIELHESLCTVPLVVFAALLGVALHYAVGMTQRNPFSDPRSWCDRNRYPGSYRLLGRRAGLYLRDWCESCDARGDSLTRIIHERFCCNRGFAAATSLDAVARRPGRRARRSVGQHTVSSMPPSLAAPRACLAWRLRDFATNRHE